MSARVVFKSALLSAVFSLGMLALCTLSLPRVEAASSSEIKQVVDSGAGLERSRKWVDAIEHYEKALKQWPETSEIESALRRSKIYLGIERRYSDQSFIRMLPGLSRSEALRMFDEVLDHVQGRYVEPVTLQTFVAHGTESLWYALGDERFQKANIPARHHADAKQVREILFREYWNKEIGSRNECTRVISDLCNLAEQQLQLQAGPVIMEFIFGGCNALDDYSGYLTPGRLNDLYGNIDGQFVGLGIEMKAEPGKGMLLMHVLPESPAAEGGLRSGEFIVGIDGKDCRNMNTDAAAGMLQGREGTRVTLDIQGKVRKLPRQSTFTRRAVIVKSLPVVRIIEGSDGVGYIQMTSFQKSTVAELDAALQKLRAEGMKSLIWDVRGNPGGLLTAAVEVLDRFIAEGAVVSTRGRTSDQNMSYSAHRPGTWNIPLVLLIDGDSASASEIVAGAIRDYRRGTIVGRKSYGKWSVQSIYNVSNNAGLRITTAKFYSPLGLTHSKVGVHPDIEVAIEKEKEATRFADEVNFETDKDIRKALEVLRGELVAR